MTASSKNASLIADHLSNLTATISDWIERLKGIGNISICEAKLEESVASPSHPRPLKILHPTGDNTNLDLLTEDGCIVKTSSSNVFTSQKDDCGLAVAPFSALADLRPSQSTSLTDQLLSPFPPNSSPMATPKQPSFTDLNPRKRKASSVTYFHDQ